MAACLSAASSLSLPSALLSRRVSVARASCQAGLPRAMKAFRESCGGNTVVESAAAIRGASVLTGHCTGLWGEDREGAQP